MNNGKTRKTTYQALLDEYNSRDAGVSQAQQGVFDINPPAQVVENANLGPAVSMNGNQAVFDDFSLGVKIYKIN